MFIAIDFDDTFTLDPPFWLEFAKSAKRAGHRVAIVTCRRETVENLAIVDDLAPDIPSFFTGHMAKQRYMEAMNVRVDVWIDDDPASVLSGK